LTKEQEALKLALKALEAHGAAYLHHELRYEEAITAVKEALAQPAQEPVAAVTSKTGNPDITMSWWHEPALLVGTKFYTAPPQRPWVGLTDAEIDSLHSEIKVRLMGTFDTKDIYQAIEAKLKEKNT
jgi:hypothetical protein